MRPTCGKYSFTVLIFNKVYIFIKLIQVSEAGHFEREGRDVLARLACSHHLPFASAVHQLPVCRVLWRHGHSAEPDAHLESSARCVPLAQSDESDAKRLGSYLLVHYQVHGCRLLRYIIISICMLIFKNTLSNSIVFCFRIHSMILAGCIHRIIPPFPSGCTRMEISKIEFRCFFFHSVHFEMFFSLFIHSFS